MYQFLNRILHPDGEIPLLSDSVFHEAPSVAEIRQCVELAGFEGAAKGCGEQHVADIVGSYRLYRTPRLSVIGDFGPVAATNLPAHGHCDLFGLEASVETQRWIVDSGNYNYSGDSMRAYCRSSIAHNVVAVDDQNQANVWSKFRMGNRPKILDLKHGSEANWVWSCGSHDGYRDSGIDKVQRVLATDGDTLACFDFGHSLNETNSKNLCGYLHFHPSLDVSAVALSDQPVFQFALQLGGVRRVVTIAAESCSLQDGWYCPEFGRRERTTVIRYLGQPNMIFGWVLHEIDNATHLVCDKSKLAITMSDQSRFIWRAT